MFPPGLDFPYDTAIVAMWYARSKKYGEKNVMYDSYAWYNHMLSDSSQMKNMPEVGLKLVYAESLEGWMAQALARSCSLATRTPKWKVCGLFAILLLLSVQVLAGSAEFRALNKPDKDRPGEAKEISKLYRQLYRVGLTH